MTTKDFELLSTCIQQQLPILVFDTDSDYHNFLWKNGVNFKKKSVHHSDVSTLTQIGCASTVVYYFCHRLANSGTQIVPNL